MRSVVITNSLARSTISHYDYAVNVLGQRTAVSATGSTFSGITAASCSSFSYNAHGELTGATYASEFNRNRSYILDSIGNRKTSRNASSTGVGSLVAAANSTKKYTEFFSDTNK